MQKPSEIKAIVFDWDGVIVDSMHKIALAIQETAASYGVQISIPEIFARFSQPKEVFYKSIGIDPEDKDELNARHAAGDDKYLINTELFSDVRFTLEKLSEKGLRFGIATQRMDIGKIAIRSEIEVHKLQNFFPIENALGGEARKEQKLLLLAKKFGVAPAELLFVGDLPSDIQAAKKAGVKSAGISRHSPMGLASAPVDGPAAARLEDEKPDFILNSLSDLLRIV